jgi:hypothetical protein
VGDVVLNELLASNDTVNQDPDFGEAGDWVELHNKGAAEQDLGGWTIADSGAQWALPAGTTIPAGGYLIVWCDDHDTTASALHTNFKLGAGGDEVTLRDAGGGFRDGLTFPAQETDVAYGRVPDGDGDWQALASPSPAAANGGGATGGQEIFINEFLASNDAGATDPDFGDFADWVELYNPGTTAVDIGGWSMTDDLAEPAQWVVPTGVSVPGQGYLIIWCDSLDQVGAGVHSGFKLSGSGEQVGLFDAAGAAVDTLTYGEQTADVSYGRSPDGGAGWTTFASPTPGEANP